MRCETIISVTQDWRLYPWLLSTRFTNESQLLGHPYWLNETLH